MTLEESREYFNQDKYAVEATGLQIDQVGDHYSKVSLTLDERHKAAHDHVMGGVFFTMADYAFAVATNRPDSLTVTGSANISYMAQPKDDRMIAECRCIKHGKATCLYEVQITDGLGTKLAHAIFNGINIHK